MNNPDQPNLPAAGTGFIDRVVAPSPGPAYFCPTILWALPFRLGTTRLLDMFSVGGGTKETDALLINYLDEDWIP